MIVTGDWGVDELVRGGETEREYGGGVSGWARQKMHILHAGKGFAV